MEIIEVLKTIIINTLKQGWYIWVILILLIVLSTVAKIFIPRINKKIDRIKTSKILCLQNYFWKNQATLI